MQAGGGCGEEEAPVFTAVLLFLACWRRLWTAGTWVPHLGEALRKLFSFLSGAVGSKAWVASAALGALGLPGGCMGWGLAEVGGRVEPVR